jgi:arsenate reductase
MEIWRAAWLEALAAHPRALQRPIITAADGTTVVGRDADALARVVEAEG